MLSHISLMDLLVPTIPTPRTPPKLGAELTKAVTVGSSSSGIPTCAMTMDICVPY